jgi:hypothetical protein
MRVLNEAGAFTAPGAGSGVHWAEHLRVSDLSVGTYSIAAGADDGQEPHTEDEIYVVTRGTGDAGDRPPDDARRPRVGHLRSGR